MALVRTKVNSREIDSILHSARLAADLRNRAERALATARANAPVASGAYRDSLHVQVVQNPSRVVARVVSNVSHSGAVEARTGNLARALDSAGG